MFELKLSSLLVLFTLSTVTTGQSSHCCPSGLLAGDITQACQKPDANNGNQQCYKGWKIDCTGIWSLANMVASVNLTNPNVNIGSCLTYCQINASQATAINLAGELCECLVNQKNFIARAGSMSMMYCENPEKQVLSSSSLSTTTSLTQSDSAKTIMQNTVSSDVSSATVTATDSSAGTVASSTGTLSSTQSLVSACSGAQIASESILIDPGSSDSSQSSISTSAPEVDSSSPAAETSAPSIAALAVALSYIPVTDDPELVPTTSSGQTTFTTSDPSMKVIDFAFSVLGITKRQPLEITEPSGGTATATLSTKTPSAGSSIKRLVKLVTQTKPNALNYSIPCGAPPSSSPGSSDTPTTASTTQPADQSTLSTATVSTSSSSSTLSQPETLKAGTTIDIILADATIAIILNERGITPIPAPLSHLPVNREINQQVQGDGRNVGIRDKKLLEKEEFRKRELCLPCLVGMIGAHVGLDWSSSTKSGTTQSAIENTTLPSTTSNTQSVVSTNGVGSASTSLTGETTIVSLTGSTTPGSLSDLVPVVPSVSSFIGESLTSSTSCNLGFISFVMLISIIIIL